MRPARDDTASIALDQVNTDELRPDRGQHGLLGNVGNSAVGIVIEPVSMDVTRPDQGQSGVPGTARVDTEKQRD